MYRTYVANRHTFNFVSKIFSKSFLKYIFFSVIFLILFLSLINCYLRCEKFKTNVTNFSDSIKTDYIKLNLKKIRFLVLNLKVYLTLKA